VRGGSSSAGSTPRVAAGAASSSVGGARAFGAALRAHAAAIHGAKAPGRKPRLQAGKKSLPATGFESGTSAPAGSGHLAGAAGSSGDKAAALHNLFSRSDVRWRALLPSGDRVGPFSPAEMVGWLAKGGPPPRGVPGADAARVKQDPGMLLLCGILAADYNTQKLPGGTDGCLCRSWGAGVYCCTRWICNTQCTILVCCVFAEVSAWCRATQFESAAFVT
jgi:hypothetical protein